MANVTVTFLEADYILEIFPEDRIKDFKVRISEELGMLVDTFDLYFEGKKLSEVKQNIFAVGIEPGVVIEAEISRKASAATRLGNWTRSTYQNELRRLQHKETCQLKKEDVDGLLDYLDAGLSQDDILSAFVLFRQARDILLYFITEVTSRGFDPVTILIKLQASGYFARAIAESCCIDACGVAFSSFNVFSSQGVITDSQQELLRVLLDIGICWCSSDLLLIVSKYKRYYVAPPSVVKIIDRIASELSELSADILQEAVFQQQPEICDVVLKNSLRIAKKGGEATEDLGTLVRTVCQSGNTEIVQIFISHIENSEILHEAAVVCISVGDLKNLKIIFSSESFCISKTSCGVSLLHQSCIHSQLEATALILEQICIKLTQEEQHQFMNGGRRSPLQIAVTKYNYKLVELLIEAGAMITSNVLISPENWGEREKTLLEQRPERYDFDDVNIPVDRAPYGNSPLIIAAKKGFADVIQFFIDKCDNLNVNFKNEHHCDALFAAATMNVHLDPGLIVRIFSMLLANGADIHTIGRVRNDEATLLAAVVYSCLERNHESRLPAVRFLIENGVGALPKHKSVCNSFLKQVRAHDLLKPLSKSSPKTTLFSLLKKK